MTPQAASGPGAEGRPASDPAKASRSESSVTARRVGAVLGAVPAAPVWLGAWWSGIGDGSWIAGAVAVTVGALIGALTWGVFITDADARRRPGIGFSALYSGCLGLVVGAFAAFPLGGFFGAFCGALGGAAAGGALRVVGVGSTLGLGCAWALGSTVGAAATWAWAW